MKNKKVVVIGGGTGLSTLLKGLKQFPLNLTAVVTVSDDGRSSGILREEFNTVAVGDIRRVLISLADEEEKLNKILNYRFNTNSDLKNHPVGNLLLVAATEATGSLNNGIKTLSEILKLKGKVVPLSTDNAILMAKMTDDSIIEGESNITKSEKKISNVYFKNDIKLNNEVKKEIKEADLIILSMGSLYTSIIPNLICEEMKSILDNSPAEIMYIANMMTQPGETDDFTVYDHIREINKYLGNKKISTVIVNNGKINEKIINKYSTLEQKDPVKVDNLKIKENNIKLITNNYVDVDECSETLRHDIIKLSLDIFGYIIK